MEHNARTRALKRTKMRALSWLLSFAMLVSLLPGMSLPAYATEASTAYVNAAGEAQTPVNATVLENSSGDTPISWNASWYVIPAGVVTIANRITVNGEVSLILTDGATLNAAGGIVVESGSLTIYGQSGGTGALNANIGENGMPDAPINGRQGPITINGGKVNATGGEMSGISAGNGLTINGGEVTATGYQGIDGSSDTVITINGGTVRATGTSGNGISVGSALTINGGDVTATGSDGISSFNGAVTINRGIVKATGSNTGINAYGGLIINGGEVTAESTSEGGGCAISASETFTINPDYAVTAGSDKDNASEVGDYAEGYNYQNYKWANIKKAAPKTPVSYMDWDAANKQPVEKKGADARSYYTIVKSNSDEFNGVKWSNGWFVVNSEVEIAGSITFKGDVKLILCDGAKLTANGGIRADFSSDENYSLTIYGQKEGTGELIVSSGNMPDAAIRGDNSSITINGGKVSATSDQSCGIYADNDVTINGGEVTAESTSAWGAEGIESFKGNIVVNGGTVKAKGSKAFYTNEQDRGVTINGGSVEATGVIYVNGDNGNVTISGGNVTVTSDETAIFARGDVTVNSGTVTATGGTDCGIFSYGDVTVSGGGLTTSGHIAIQAYKDNGGVTISGGTMTATGTGDDGIGISTNYNGSVTISGGAATLAGSGCAISTSSVTIGNGIAVNAGASETNNAPIDNFSESYFTEGYTYKWVQVGNFHEHSLTNYTLISGDTITATCSNTNKCPLNNNQATLTIIASTDSGGTAALTGDVNAFDVSDANITYQKKNGGSWTKITADQISNSGFYKAGITVGGKTASVTYGVNEIIKDGSFNPATANGDFTVPSVATANASVTINTEPALGYELDTLTVKKSNNSAITVTKNGNDGSFTMPEESVTVSATFKKINSGITISAMENGSVSANKTTADYGDTVTLTITPNAGYALGTITARNGNNEPVSITNGSFTMPASAVTVSATFVLIDYTVTVGTIEHGSIQASKTNAAHVGEEITLTVDPDEGYELDALKFNDTAITGATKFTMPASNVTVTATFKKIDYTVTVTTPTNGTLSADKATAQMGDTVTLTVTPDGGYKVSNVSVIGAATTKVNDTTYTFTMPASNITASVTFILKDCDVTVSNSIIGGTIEVSPTTMEIGDVITLIATPDAGYQFDSYTVTKADGSSIVVTNNKFTMPAGIVTVNATFAPRNVPVNLAVSGGDASCTAAILDDSYSEINSVTKKVGDKFILRVNRDDEYDFTVTGATTTEFTDTEYQNYYNYAKAHDTYVSLNTVLLWVTMPGVSGDSATVTVTFQKQQTYTILYQPADGTNPDIVVCKMVRNVNNNDETSYTALQRGATMGDGTAVWSMKMTAAFAPTQIAFVAANKPSTNDEKNALATTLENASLNTATVSQNTDTWNDLSGAKYLIIGGDAKVVTAAFITDPSKTVTYKDSTVDAPEITEGKTYVTYQLAVVTESDGTVTPGTVKAPAAPDAPTGHTFGGWRGFDGTNVKVKEATYQPNDTIKIRENATFNVVWKPVTLTVTLNRNGGRGGTNVTSAAYGEELEDKISDNPTRSGFAFDGWTVSDTVTEDGTLFAKGSPFDLGTKITTNLGLTAQWKHVHSYDCYRITLFPSLEKYYKYDSTFHVAVCGCDKAELTAHEFDISGKCACGYQLEPLGEVSLNISYGQWSGGTYTEKMKGIPETAKSGQEVSIYAPDAYGDLQFSKWQYSTDGSTWNDFAATTFVGFIIRRSMQVRALYINPVTVPQVDLSARLYDDQAVVDGETLTMDNILFHLNYKLPDGYTFEDAGIRLGDNNGISYYFIQQVKYSYDNKSKGIIAGMTAGLAGLGVLASNFGGDGDPVGLIMDVASADYEGYGVNYLETEDNVLEKENMDAATLAKYMYESKPVNVEKYDPIYWEAKAVTKGMSGSMATIPPLRFAQKYGGRHYIYGIGYLRYKTPSGEIKTIYTDALPAAVKYMPNYTVTKQGS